MSKDTGIVQIRNKDGSITEYQTVAYRITKFWAEHPEHSLQTEIRYHTDDRIRFVAKITDKDGRLLATGHAEKFFAGDNAVVEKCETKAIGRALASYGLVGNEFCTADELAGVVANAWLAVAVAAEWLKSCRTIEDLGLAWKIVAAYHSEIGGEGIEELTRVKDRCKEALNA